MRKRVLMSSVAATVVASMFMFTGCGNTTNNDSSDAAESVAKVEVTPAAEAQKAPVAQETPVAKEKTSCVSVEGGVVGVQVVGYNADGSVLNKSRTNSAGEVCFEESPVTIEVKGSGLDGDKKVRCDSGVQAYVQDGKVRCGDIASSGIFKDPKLFRSLVGTIYEALGVPFNAYDKAILAALNEKTITGALAKLQNFTYIDGRNRAQKFQATPWKQDVIEHVVNIYNSKVSDDTKTVVFASIDGLIKRGPVSFASGKETLDNSGSTELVPRTDMDLNESLVIHLFDGQRSYDGVGAGESPVLLANPANTLANHGLNMPGTATGGYLPHNIDRAGVTGDDNVITVGGGHLANASHTWIGAGANATGTTEAGLNVINVHDTILQAIERFLTTYENIPGGVDKKALAIRLISEPQSGNAFAFENIADPATGSFTNGLTLVQLNKDGSSAGPATGEFVANCVTNSFIECAPGTDMFVADGFNTAHKSGDKFMINNISSVCGSSFTKLDANGNEIEDFAVPARFTNSQRYVKFSPRGLSLSTEDQYKQMQNYLRGAISMELANANIDINDSLRNGDTQGDYINFSPLTANREHEVIASFVLEFPERCDQDTIEEYLTISYRARYIPLSEVVNGDEGAWALVPLGSGDDGDKTTFPEIYPPAQTVELQSWMPSENLPIIPVPASDSNISLVQGSNDNGITLDITDLPPAAGHPDNDPSMADSRFIPAGATTYASDDSLPPSGNHDTNNYVMTADHSANVMITVRAYDEVVGGYIEFQKHMDVEHFPTYISGRLFNPFADMDVWLKREVDQVSRNSDFAANDRTIQPLDYELIQELLVSNFSNAPRANKPESGEPGPFVTKLSMVRYADDEERISYCMDRTRNQTGRPNKTIMVAGVPVPQYNTGVVVFDDGNDWLSPQANPAGTVPCVVHPSQPTQLTWPAEVPALAVGDYPFYPMGPRVFPNPTFGYNRTNNFAERIESLHRISNRTPEQEHLLAMFQSQLNFIQNPGTMNPAAYKMLVGTSAHPSNNTWGDEDSHIDDDLTYIYDRTHTKINAIEIKTCLTDCCNTDDDEK